jgi:hypothetical protein
MGSSPDIRDFRRATAEIPIDALERAARLSSVAARTSGTFGAKTAASN